MSLKAMHVGRYCYTSLKCWSNLCKIGHQQNTAIFRNLQRASRDSLFKWRYASSSCTFLQDPSSSLRRHKLSIHDKYNSLIFTQNRNIQTSPCLQQKSDNPEETSDDANLSIFQRFKNAYKQHGKILIGVHVATSTVWFGAFYYAATTGLDIIPWLEWVGASESLIKHVGSSGLGDIAMAYLLYKLATPARYTVTLAGTNLAIRYFRKTGRMPDIPEGDSIRELYQDGKYKIKETSVRELYEDGKEKIKETSEKLKETSVRELYEDGKYKIKETSEKLKEKSVRELYEDGKYKIKETSEKLKDMKKKS